MAAIHARRKRASTSLRSLSAHAAICIVLLLVGAPAPISAALAQTPIAPTTPYAKLRVISEERPGKTDPVQNPARYKLFSDDAVYLPAAKNQRPVEVTLRPGNPNLKDWTVQIEDTGHCATGGRRYARGRIASPENDQIVCVTEGEVTILNPFRRFILPDAASTPGRAVSVAVGDLDRFVDENGIRHDEVVVSYQRHDGRQRLYVLDQHLAPMAHWDAPPRSGYQSAVAVGDFTGLDPGAIVLALAASGPEARADRALPKGIASDLTLYTFRLQIDRTNGSAQLVLANSLRQRADSAYASLALAAGDYDGDGRDEFVLSYYIADGSSPLKLELYDTDRDLRIQSGGTAVESRPWAGSYTSLTSGLLHLLPPNYTVQRRQLALSYIDTGGKVLAALYDVEDGRNLRRRSRSEVDRISSVNEAGVGITSGNFVGLANTSSPSWQLAVQVPVPVGNATFPRFIVLGVANDFSLSEIYRHDYREFTSAAVWSQEITAYDPDGKSYVLGAPIHITVPEIIDTKYVIQEPPKHVDCLPSSDGCEIVNVSGSSQFYVELSDSKDKTLETTARDTTSWDIGASAAVSSSSTIGGGFGDIGRASVTVSAKAAVSYDYNQITENTNSVYQSVTVQSTETTNIDDQAIYNVRLLDLWRYPVFGLKLENPPTQQGYYELILPGPTIEFNGAASIHDWYQPLHQNHNILSYASISDPDFPPDLGSFVPQGSTEPVRAPLNARVRRYWDGNQQTYDINWSERAGSTSSKTYTSTLRETVDVGLGFSASVDAFFVQADSNLQFDFNFQNSNSFQQNTISGTQMASMRGIRLNKPGAEGAAYQAYAFDTLVYITEQGTLRVAHAVDPTGAPSGAGWWRETYGRAPDPAVNLPNRLIYDKFEWKLAPEPARYQMRGFFLRKSEKNPVTGQYNYIGGLIDAGDKIKVQSRVYNLSLFAQPVAFDTLIEVAEVDPADNKIIGDKIPIGRERVTLGPRGQADVTLDWDTSTLHIPDDTVRYYRFFVTADPDNQVKNEIHEGAAVDGNNYGFWPWDGGVGIAGKKTARGMPSAAASLRLARLDLFDHKKQQVVGEASVGQRYGLRATFESTGLWRAWTPVFFLLDDGRGERKVIGTRTLRGAGPGRAYVWLDWNPVKVGQYAFGAARAEDIIAQKRAGSATAQPPLSVEVR